eukprot:7298146-Heterocapsa_arctica.AAC.1
MPFLPILVLFGSSPPFKSRPGPRLIQARKILSELQFPAPKCDNWSVGEWQGLIDELRGSHANALRALEEMLGTVQERLVAPDGDDAAEQMVDTSEAHAALTLSGTQASNEAVTDALKSATSARRLFLALGDPVGEALANQA